LLIEKLMFSWKVFCAAMVVSWVEEGKRKEFWSTFTRQRALQEKSEAREEILIFEVSIVVIHENVNSLLNLNIERNVKLKKGSIKMLMHVTRKILLYSSEAIKAIQRKEKKDIKSGTREDF
jgi:hypothetical protein